MKSTHFAAALAAVLGVTGIAAAQDMIACSWSGQIYTIDSSTGIGSPLGSSGASSLNSMATNGAGTVWVIGGSTLYTINTSTGAATPVGATAGLDSVRGLAYQASSGLLYCVEDNGVGAPDELWTLDPGTLATGLLGSTNFPGLQGLAFTPDGRLWSWDVGSGSGFGDALIELNPTTGAGANVDPSVGTSPTSGFFQFLTSDSSGQLYAGQNELYKVDKVTSLWTLVGSGGYSSLRGCDFTTVSSCNPVFYCTSKTSSSGCVPYMQTSGPAGANTGCPATGACDYSVITLDVEANKPGIIFYGYAPAAISFMGGTLCVQPPIRRTPPQSSGGSGACTGSLTLVVNCPGDAPGTHVFYQGWFRDPADPFGAGLSDAVELVFQ